MRDHKKEMIPVIYKNAENFLRALWDGEFDDTLGIADVAMEVKMSVRKEKEFRFKEKTVKRIHVKKDGSFRAISEISRDGDSYFFTKTADGKQITAKDYDDLIGKLYDFYGGDYLLNNHSVAKAWNLYVADYRRMNPEKGKTIENMSSEYRRFVSEEFSKRDIRKLTVQDLELYCMELIREKQLKKRAFLNFKTILNCIFGTAMYEGWIVVNPAKLVRNHRLIEMCDQSLSSREVEDVTLSDEEKELVFAETNRRKLLGRNKGYYYFDAMIRLHCEIGCRPGELCALRWDDLRCGSDGKPMLHIHAQIKEIGMKRKYEYVPITKDEKGVSRGGRYFPLTTNALAILDEMRHMQEQYNMDDGFIFCHRDGSFIPPDSYAIYVKSVFNSVGIKGKSSYVFRRGVNQLLDSRGVSPTNRAKLLGHTVQTNISYYTFASRDVIEEGRKALESLAK